MFKIGFFIERSSRMEMSYYTHEEYREDLSCVSAVSPCNVICALWGAHNSRTFGSQTALTQADDFRIRYQNYPLWVRNMDFYKDDAVISR